MLRRFSSVSLFESLKKYKHIAFFIMLQLAVGFCFGQTSLQDSIHHLKQINIIGERTEMGCKLPICNAVTKQAVMIDYSTKNLSDVLEHECNIFMKTYGLSSLSTCSMRGGSAYHTSILWNGLNISNPMYGTIDFSLIPIFFLSNISVEAGGASSVWGSGAVGGVIQLNNQPIFNDGIKFNFINQIGSFGLWQKQFSLQYSTKKISTAFKFFHQAAHNNFPYYNTAMPDTTRVRQTHAQVKQYGFLSENYFKINSKQEINLMIWNQFADRQIPPTMLQSFSDAYQQDKNLRISSQWSYANSKMVYSIKTGFFDEQINYFDSLKNISAHNHTQTFIAQGASKFYLKNNDLEIGINNTAVKAIADGYLHKVSQNKFAINIADNFHYKNLQASASIRKEMQDNQLVPFVFSIGGGYLIKDWMKVSADIAKVYRAPTLNDLYWSPGGNPDLKPEMGYSHEAGVSFLSPKIKGNARISSTMSCYSRKIDNWIIWLPGALFATPKNELQVWSRGMETKNELSFSVKKIYFKINVLTDYVLSTIEKSAIANDASVGKLLIYTPMYSGHAKFDVQYKNFLISFMERYVGYRYTSSDNTEYLKPYRIASIYTGYSTSFKKYSINFFAELNNIFNEKYQVIENRAMPLCNYNFGINFQFHKKQTHRT